ncbi:MAG TPA: serine/threonine-protein kinase [Kofleriaceae bacterium]|nr:serine/threonine-protein kinase [Kofleriaceae bacterium]
MSRALGRYELLRPIARGGMAEVFLARRRAAGVEKWLVVKRMRPERASDARFLELFVREAKLSMSLAHQNIVPVFDFGRVDDQVFIAMERVEGRDLGSTLARAGTPLPPLLAAFVAAECCQALDYAHLRRGPDGAPLGIVHRDVTPRNVMLSWSGEVKLTDFGIAALAGEKSSVIGTPGYMAPEQARGEALDPRADVYAVGMVLREALTAERPRPGSERETTLVAARAGTLVPWPAGFASPLVAIVDRATALDREARYPDARAMLEELDTFIVAERAANKSDAPARRLAAWLAETWKDEREESAIDEAIEGSHLVSFLDDGGLDAMGTGTERSMAATAAEEVAAAPPAPIPVVAPVAAPASKRRLWIPIAAVVIAGGAFAAVKLTRKAAPPEVASIAPGDARLPDAMTIDAELVVLAVPDAAPAMPDAAVHVTAEVHRPRPKPPVVPPPAAETHKVTVNTQPWSYFTIDDAPLQHQTLEVVHLTSGPHVLHFSRDKIHKDVAITVPAGDNLADDSLTVVQDMSH